MIPVLKVLTGIRLHWRPHSPMTVAFALALPSALLASVLAMRVGYSSVLLDTPLRTPYFVVLMVGACAQVLGPALIFSGFIRDDAVGILLKPLVVVIGSALVGWVVFWVWFASPAAGMLVSIVLTLSTGLGLILRPQAILSPSVYAPLLFCVLLSVFYILIAGDHGGLDQGVIAIAHRYWVSVDNAIPMIFADQLTAGRDALVTNFLEGSQSSERPPLQVGMILPLYGLAVPDIRSIAYIPLGIAANSTWVIALWGFLRRFLPSERRIALVVVAVGLVGPVFVNTIYAWPKMLMAALVISAAAFLLSREIRPWIAAIVSALAAGLALFAHGSGAFGLMGLLPLVFVAVTRWKAAAIGWGVLAALVIYVPWLLYQRLFDPPGDRLIKWHLAGVIPPNHTPPIEQILIAYGQAGLVGTAHNKLANLEAMFGTPSVWSGLIAERSQPAWSVGGVGFVRQLQSSSIVLAVGLLLVGVLVAIILPRVRRQRWVKPIVIIVLTTTVAFALGEFGAPTAAAAWLHHSPYSLLLLLAAAGALGITSLPCAWQVVLLGTHAAFFFFVWVFRVSTQSAFEEALGQSIDVPSTVAAGFVAAAIAWVVFHELDATAPKPSALPPRQAAGGP